MENNHVLINLWQTPWERQQKYWLCRSLGVSSYQAIKMRDWRLAKIERFFALLPPTERSYRNRAEHDCVLQKYTKGQQPLALVP